MILHYIFSYPKDSDINESEFKSSFNFTLYSCPELVKRRMELINESMLIAAGVTCG